MTIHQGGKMPRHDLKREGEAHMDHGQQGNKCMRGSELEHASVLLF